MVIISGIIGARLMFVLTNYPSWFVSEPLQVFKVWEGGLAWHGWLLGGFLVGWPYCRKNSVNPNMIADWIVVGLSFGYIIVRIGIFSIKKSWEEWHSFLFGRWPAQISWFSYWCSAAYKIFLPAKQDLPAGYQFWSFIWYHSVLRAVFEETVRETLCF